MMIKRIGIVGAGAIGCSLGSALYREYGMIFVLLQRERGLKS